jgi:hypothetical protein
MSSGQGSPSTSCIFVGQRFPARSESTHRGLPRLLLGRKAAPHRLALVFGVQRVRALQRAMLFWPPRMRRLSAAADGLAQSGTATS